MTDAASPAAPATPPAEPAEPASPDAAGPPAAGAASPDPLASGEPGFAVRVARERQRDVEWPADAAPPVPAARLRRDRVVAWAVVVAGWVAIFVVPFVLVAWVTAGWVWPWLRGVLAVATLVPAAFVALIWWLAITVSVGTKCPACGDVLHEQVTDSVTPLPGGRRRCGNCLAAVAG